MKGTLNIARKTHASLLRHHNYVQGCGAGAGAGAGATGAGTFCLSWSRWNILLGARVGTGAVKNRAVAAPAPKEVRIEQN